VNFVRIKLPDGLDDQVSVECREGYVAISLFDTYVLALSPTEAHLIASAIEEAARRAK